MKVVNLHISQSHSIINLWFDRSAVLLEGCVIADRSTGNSAVAEQCYSFFTTQMEFTHHFNASSNTCRGCSYRGVNPVCFFSAFSQTTQTLGFAAGSQLDFYGASSRKQI